MTHPKAFDNEGVQFAWDQTSLSYAMNCLRKYKLVMLEGWKPRQVNDNLKFGGHYASALEHFHKHRADGKDYDEAVVEVVTEAMIATWDVKTEVGGMTLADALSRNVKYESVGPWKSLHNTKTRENLIRTIIWYLEHFRNDPTPTIILSNGSPAVEHTFALPVDNDIILTGHFDRLVEFSGDPYIQDQKSTAHVVNSRYFSQYKMDNQMFQYTFAGKALLGSPIKGVIIDAAQVAVGFSRFERGFVFIDDSQLNEWYDHTLSYIQLTQEATRKQYFPMNRTSCNDYGGCQFREVCSKALHVRDNFLRADFVRGKRWDPLETR